MAMNFDDSKPGQELWHQWLLELAEDHRRRQSKLYFVYKRAADSLKDCKTPLTHPRQALRLRNIGASIVATLEKKCVSEGFELCQDQGNEPIAEIENTSEGGEVQETKQKKKIVRNYVPKYRSSAFAILLALHLSPTSLSCSNLCRAAKPYCDHPVEKRNGMTFNNLKTAMKTLEGRNLILVSGKPSLYELTEEGVNIATKLHDLYSQITADDNERNATSQNVNEDDHITTQLKKTLDPDEYDIIALLDHREAKTNKDRALIEDILQNKNKVESETQALDLGDIIWVAECKATHARYVLDYVIERKRTDDLAASIKDGRFTDQKLRLKKSGLSTIIYLIENYQLADNQMQQAIKTAISSMQAIDGLFVKEVDSFEQCLHFIARLHVYIKKKYKEKKLQIVDDQQLQGEDLRLAVTATRKKYPNDLPCIPYETFMRLSSKDQIDLHTLTIRMLMCIKEVSPTIAVQITSLYPTINHIIQAARNKSEFRESLRLLRRSNTNRQLLHNKLIDRIMEIFV